MPKTTKKLVIAKFGHEAIASPSPLTKKSEVSYDFKI